METSRVSNVSQLVDRIGAGIFNFKNHDNPAIKIFLWNNRVIIGSYTDKSENIASRSDVITDNEKLTSLVNRLLNEGISFVTQTGSHDLLCVIEWTIE